MFKNASVYWSTKPLTVESYDLQEVAFKPISGMQTESMGFVAPRGFAVDDLAPRIEHFTLLSVKTESKILPAQAINKRLAEEAAKIEAKESRKVYRKERAELRDEIIFDMLPKAFTKERLTAVLIDYKNKLVFVDTTSSSHAENILNLLREALGSLAVIPLVGGVLSFPQHVITNRLVNNQQFVGEYGTKLKLSGMIDKTTHTYRNELIDCEEIIAFIKAGMMVEEVELIGPFITCTVTDSLRLKAIKLSDDSQLMLEEQLEDIDAEDEALSTKATVLIIGNALSDFVLMLVRELGGMVDHSNE